MTTSPESVLALLVAQPRRLLAVTADVPADVLRRSPGEGEWSAAEVVAHLRACGDVWGDAVRRIVTEESPAVRAVNPRTWITSTGHRAQDPHVALRAFQQQRDELVALLQRLPEDAWSRRATVTGAGRPLERTVLDYATRLGTHERPHVRQVERAVAVLTAAPL